eukprot:TRINITY_DN14372_c0_g1_i1.p1 TRINITY_DN14372_c0_g1~~TRINITY_DN14372_c0_g1_i1.p1  ORF type:complete len:104 (+),score=26.23 TRINITY_DN14372_c0_g1_i1:2-313(+)
MQRQEREEEKRRSREQKRLQEQLTAEQEAIFGSKPSPLRPLMLKKPLGQNSSTVNMAAGGTPKSRRATTPSARHAFSGAKEKESGKACVVIPENYVALSKDDP